MTRPCGLDLPEVPGGYLQLLSRGFLAVWGHLWVRLACLYSSHLTFPHLDGARPVKGEDKDQRGPSASAPKDGVEGARGGDNLSHAPETPLKGQHY